jgi:hypothetical protein
MTSYRVRWDIDVDADSPHAAARAAREIMLDPHSTATYFRIIDNENGSKCGVNLEREIWEGEFV